MAVARDAYRLSGPASRHQRLLTEHGNSDWSARPTPRRIVRVTPLVHTEKTPMPGRRLLRDEELMRKRMISLREVLLGTVISMFLAGVESPGLGQPSREPRPVPAPHQPPGSPPGDRPSSSRPLPPAPPLEATPIPPAPMPSPAPERIPPAPAAPPAAQPIPPAPAPHPGR